MKSAFWRSIAVVALVAAPMMANANDATIGSETAYHSMQGGTLMNTTAIFNVFPHLVVDNGTGVEINTMGDGMGKVWWEAYDNLWLTMDVGRMDYGISGSSYMWGGMAGGSDSWPWNPYPFSKWATGVDENGVSEGEPGYDPSTEIIHDAAMMVNLGIAKALSGGGGWAARVMFAPNGGSETTNTVDRGGSNVSYTDERNVSAFGVNGSFGNGDGLYIGAEFALTTVEEITVTNNQTDPLESETTDHASATFGLNGRYDTDTYIYQASVSSVAGTKSFESVPTADPKVEDLEVSGFAAMANAGRYLKNDVDGQATAEFMFGWVSTNDEQKGRVDENDQAIADKNSDSEFFLPGVRVSAWEKITNRFGLMGGVGFRYAMATNKVEDPEEATQESETKTNNSEFTWSAGLFFQPSDNVRLDARFMKDNLNQILSLGNSSPLVMYIGATVGLN